MADPLWLASTILEIRTTGMGGRCSSGLAAVLFLSAVLTMAVLFVVWELFVR